MDWNKIEQLFNIGSAAAEHGPKYTAISSAVQLELEGHVAEAKKVIEAKQKADAEEAGRLKAEAVNKAREAELAAHAEIQKRDEEAARVAAEKKAEEEAQAAAAEAAAKEEAEAKQQAERMAKQEDAVGDVTSTRRV